MFKKFNEHNKYRTLVEAVEKREKVTVEEVKTKDGKGAWLVLEDDSKTSKFFSKQSRD